MLVCRQCGTEILVAGRPCPACGCRGAIDPQFFHGTVKQASRAAVEAFAAEHRVTAAWSPWLAALVALCIGPPGGVVFAATNLKRLGRPVSPEWWSLAALVGQVAVGALAGHCYAERPEAAMLLPALYQLVIALALLRWQWRTVAEYRTAHPGRHVPGPDALGALALGAVIGLVSSLGMVAVGNWTGHGVMSRAIRLLTSPTHSL